MTKISSSRISLLCVAKRPHDQRNSRSRADSGPASTPHARPEADDEPSEFIDLNIPTSGGEVRLKQNPAGQWHLVHPRCVQERELDLEDVEEMLDAGEIDVARDELRWLLNGCSDHIAIHYLLGDLALAENDLPLARAHYGYAFQIGYRAWKKAYMPLPFTQDLPENELFFAAGKQLAWCLKLLEKKELLNEVVAILLRCDPRDPLQLKALL